MDTIPLSPGQASTVAKPVDTLFFVLVLFSAILTVVILAGATYLTIKYRRGSRADRSRPLREHPAVELTWSLVMLVIGLGIFFWGASLYIHMRRQPADALEVYVLGKQWMWQLYHPEGRAEINELHIPVGQPVKLTMISQDVIHSFFVPAFRLKQDVLPGRYTTLWFQATQTGRYHLFCAEYCGTKHAAMIGSIIVMEPAEYQRWLSGAGYSARRETMAEAGGRHFQRLGCVSCHLAGDSQRGPALAGLYGQKVQLQSGEIVVADDSYLRESVLQPTTKVVAGYQPIMPTYEGLVGEKELLELVAYLKSLGSAAPR